MQLGVDSFAAAFSASNLSASPQGVNLTPAQRMRDLLKRSSLPIR